MNNKSLKTLEYTKIVDMLCSKAISKLGKAMAKEIKPSIDIKEINKNLAETTEAAALILRRGSLPLGGIKEISEILKRAAIGGSLSPEELVDVSDFLYCCKKVVNYRNNDRDTNEYPILQPLLDLIEALPTLEKEINKCITPNYEIVDNASSDLYTIRQNIKRTNSRIKEHLVSIINSTTYKNMLQDNVITIRNDRFCVPVKMEYKNSFKGMVHDQSSTGATVFIEPISVVEQNNKIKELKSEEKKEIEKILKSLSFLVEEKVDVLSANSENLQLLDFAFAKGELSIELDGSEPVFNTKGYINIKKGRHPLLDPKTVVPTDIYLGDKFTTLLITGPNTGGKTVTLKTLGLFTLMGQSGMHIPALSNSELTVFDNVFADIGDEQSIEQSLSTFSSHMSNIVNILGEVTEKSLVLLDELGAGTDPTEGAALAIGILQDLYARGIRVAVTTHYSELKVYALGTEGVENACCEFNVETLKPTYKLLIGVPGKSNAFAISRRLGLPEYIINDAKEHLSSEEERFEDVITDLEISKRSVIEEQEKAESFRREAEKLKKDFEKQKERLEKQREKIVNEAKEEAKKVLQNAKADADSLVQELNKKIKNKDNIKDIEKTRQEIRDRLKDFDGDVSLLVEENNSQRPHPTNIKAGDNLFVHSMGQSGVAMSTIGKDGKVMVQIGMMKMKIHVSNLEIEKPKKQKQAQKSYGGSKGGKSLSIKPELDIRGHMVEEGINVLDKYLDDVCLSSLNQVTIIHGKGTGVLRKAVHEHLKRYPHVKSYRLGTFGEGEDGVTIVDFK